MQIVYNLFNHREEGKRSLEDVVMILVHQMRALGHDAKWGTDQNQFVTSGNGLNVLVEGFSEWSVGKMAEAHAGGARFLILATEEPTEKGFNHGIYTEMARRQAIFPRAAALCEGILHLVPGEAVTRWYGQHAPAAYADLGHAPSLVRFDRREPDFDFGFYGALSKRRLKILRRLAKVVGTPRAVTICADFKSQDDRDREMGRAKVIVQVRKHDEMGLVSSSRCCTALCLGRPVVAEPHLLSKPWDEVVTFSKTLDGFFSSALLARSTWRGMHAAQMARFVERMSPQRCVGDALAAIGVESPRRAAA